MSKQGRKTKPKAREAYLAQVARLYLQGVPQYKIAEQLERTKSQITYDLNFLNQRWRESSLVDLHQKKIEELKKIDLVEAECWEAWEASKRPLQRTLEEQTKHELNLKPERGAKGSHSQRLAEDVKSKAQVVKTLQTGDPQYMKGIQWAIEKRIQIFGLLAPTKIASTSVDGKDAPFNVNVNAKPDSEYLNEFFTSLVASGHRLPGDSDPDNGGAA